VVALNEAPARLGYDNEAEPTRSTLQACCPARGIALLHIQTGNPDRNAILERFNQTYPEGVHNASLFAAIGDVLAIGEP